MSDIPRWQQGPRPLAHGDTWDAMTPAERRNAFLLDLVVAGIGSLLVWLAFS